MRSKTSRLTRSQIMMVLATRTAQNGIRRVTLGRLNPKWVLPVAAHFLTENRRMEEEKSETSDSDPVPLSLVTC